MHILVSGQIRMNYFEQWCKNCHNLYEISYFYKFVTGCYNRWFYLFACTCMNCGWGVYLILKNRFWFNAFWIRKKQLYIEFFGNDDQAISFIIEGTNLYYNVDMFGKHSSCERIFDRILLKWVYMYCSSFRKKKGLRFDISWKLSN